MKRYQALADSVARMVSSGALAPGDRVPSVRQASRHFGVSPSTVFKAYYLLESRGLIRARERSGYYVSDNAARLLPEPTASRPRPKPQSVSVDDLIFSVLDATQQSGVAALGAAFPAPQFLPLPRLAQSLGRANRGAISAGDETNLSPGNEALRQAIARRYMGAGISVTADDVIVTNGALEALTLSLRAVTRPGDTVAIESPGFYAALQIIQMLNLRALEIPMDPARGLDLGALESALRGQDISACWCMTNYQNPLGSTMDEDRKRVLVQLLARHDVALIEDDVYGELYFGGKYRRPAKAFDSRGLVLHCGSFSKSLAPGYRIGWVLPGSRFENIRRGKLVTTLSACVPAQLAIADYLQAGGYDRHLRKLRFLLEDHQALAARAIAASFPSGTKVSRPAGGYFLWLEMPPEIDAMALYRLALGEAISLAPGPMFSAAGDYRNCIRVNYGLPVEALIPALETVGRLAHQMVQSSHSPGRSAPPG